MTSNTPKTCLRAVPACLVVALIGCDLSGDRLFRMHTAPDRKAEARRHWDDMRGNARLQLAQRHLEAGRLADAEKELEAALAACPDEPAAYILATRIRLELGQLAEARESLAAAKKRSVDPETDYLEGVIDQRYGDTESALAAYTRAGEKAPLVPEYVLARAEMLVALDRASDAFNLIQERMPDFDRDVSLRSLAARIARALNRKNDAVAQAQEAAQLSDDEPEATAYLGDTLVWAHQMAAAVDVLRPLARALAGRSSNAHDADPESPPQPDTGDLAAASRQQSRRIAEESQIEFARGVMHNFAQACLAEKRFQDAIAILTPWVKAHPEDVLSSVSVARAALGLNDSKTASDLLTRAHHAATPTPESLLLLAYAEFKRGRYDAASDAAQAAVTLDDRLASAFCLIGRAAQARDRMDAARSAYRQALTADPDSTAARALLRALARTTGEKTETNEADGAVTANRPAELSVDDVVAQESSP